MGATQLNEDGLEHYLRCNSVLSLSILCPHVSGSSLRDSLRYSGFILEVSRTGNSWLVCAQWFMVTKFSAIWKCQQA